MTWLLAVLVLLVVAVVRRRAAHRGYARPGAMLDTGSSVLAVLPLAAGLALHGGRWEPLRSRARSRHLRPSTARWLASGRRRRVWGELARKSALERDLMLLLPDADDQVKASMAADPVLPVHLQHALAADPSDGVRCVLAGNPCQAAGPLASALSRRGGLSPALRWRSRDLHGGVRGAAVAIRTSYRQLPQRASAHADPLIRVAVTGNPGQPAGQLEQLPYGPHPEGRHAARQRVLAGLAVVA